MGDSVYTFLALLNNPAVRKIIGSSSKLCLSCGKSHIEVALDDYAETGDKRRRCIKAKFISKFVRYTFDNSAKAFGVTKEQLKEGLSDTYIRRGITNVLAGAATFGISKPQTVGAPFLVVWNYTNACNLSCKHCYQNAQKASFAELSTAQRKHIVDQLDQERVVSVAFSGGEPLMCSDFFEVAAYAARKGLYVSMASNGTMISSSVAKKLKKCGVGYVDVSLDGAIAQTHESFRGVPGCYERTLTGIRNLVDQGITVCVAVTATKHNLHEIPCIIELAKNIKAKRVIVFNFIPTGRGREITGIDLTSSEREQLLEHICDELVAGEIETLCTAPQLARVCLSKSSETNQEVFAPTHFYAADLGGKIRV